MLTNLKGKLKRVVNTTSSSSAFESSVTNSGLPSIPWAWEDDKIRKETNICAIDVKGENGLNIYGTYKRMNSQNVKLKNFRDQSNQVVAIKKNIIEDMFAVDLQVNDDIGECHFDSSIALEKS